ncbi:GntR family transcriptional regulator [Amycolatopsis jiangsuensis]|uniref:DNA-binding GntR family transcriptional regulator n=1 Tax=Amycolatopsis jiangsuensis TaxID=1181879 RepID=A0A840IR51_9PSEU|nr:GntR family transcriptional regulator [Amycolatopsis jiangsuensis]MBB4683514.1 DNA-binding GntR family transcriptional regulator [Amycolatopsis jiangsuensis]
MTAPGPGLVTDKLSEQIYRLLRSRIVHGELEPGHRIDLPALIAELGISKTPLREALARLEIDGLVSTKPRSGTFVATLTVKDIGEVCDLRRGIEWAAASEAARRIPEDLVHELRAEVVEAERKARDGDYEPFFASDQRLHAAIMTHSGNDRLIRVRDSVEAYVQWMRVVGATGPHRIAGSSRRHREILDALLTREPADAAAAVAQHIEEVKIWTIEDFGQLGHR